MAPPATANASAATTMEEGDVYMVDQLGCIHLVSARKKESDEELKHQDSAQVVLVETVQDDSTACSSTHSPPPKFEVGDHIATWCNLPGVSEQAYQHHGIVLDLKLTSNGSWIMKVADFSYWAQPGNSINTTSRYWSSMWNNSNNREESEERDDDDGLRTYETPADDPKWFKVQYEYDPSSSVGTNSSRNEVKDTPISTTAHSDEVHIVLERVMFLVAHPEVMPNYDLLAANCETVAVWCKTGTWATLQVISGLEEFAKRHQRALFDAAGQSARSGLYGLWRAAALPASASETNSSTTSFQTTSTAGGIGASFRASAHHHSATGVSPQWLAAYGMLAVATPKLLLWYTKGQWQEITQELNTAFWELSVGLVEDEEELVFDHQEVEYAALPAMVQRV